MSCCRVTKVGNGASCAIDWIAIAQELHLDRCRQSICLVCVDLECEQDVSLPVAVESHIALRYELILIGQCYRCCYVADRRGENLSANPGLCICYRYGPYALLFCQIIAQKKTPECRVSGAGENVSAFSLYLITSQSLSMLIRTGRETREPRSMRESIIGLT